jgi:hypothetical protein
MASAAGNLLLDHLRDIMGLTPDREQGTACPFPPSAG